MSATLAPDTVREIEDRAGVDALGDLQFRRRTLMRQLAPLAALHGNFGKWEAKRSQMSRALRVKARMELTEKGIKPTDKMAEEYAAADPQYAAFIDDGIAGHIDYLNLHTELVEIEERIESRKAELYAWGKEARLGE